MMGFVWHERGENWRPTRGQELLLRCAFREGESALAAWRIWKASEDIYRLDPHSWRLLPLVHANLEKFEISDPLLLRLKSVRRKTWYQSQMLFARADPILDACRTAGLKNILLKGAALILSSYRDPSLRPLEDIDILIAREEIDEARLIFEGLNWRLRCKPSISKDFYWMWANHAFAYTDDQGGQIDLHWDIRMFHGPDDMDGTIWRHVGVVHRRGRKQLILSPEDQLLHILDHATGPRPSPIRWIPDALFLLRTSAGGMDWGRFVDRSVKQRMVLRSRKMLLYLKESFDANIPEVILQSLQGKTATRFEIRYYKTTLSGRTGALFWSGHFFRPLFLLSFDPQSRQAPLTYAVRYWKLWKAVHNIRFIWDIPSKAAGMVSRALKKHGAK